MSRHLVGYMLVALGAIALAGCGGGEALSTADAVETTTVTMPRSYRFEPAVIRIDAGDTVTWKNEDNFTHDVTLESGDDTDGHTVKPGDEVQVTFDEAGTFDYECRLHSSTMRGKVVVT